MSVVTEKLSYPNSIALELVPNSYELLLSESTLAIQRGTGICSINIPEMRSKAIKGYHAAEHLLRHGIDAIPHFRTIDRTYEELESLVAPLIPLGLKSILLITGDPIKDIPNFQPSGVTPVNAIPRLKAKFPGLNVYAGFDPYRQGFRAELDYCKEKIAAGAAGFFTQPFFSPFLLDAWLEQLQETEVWVGVSPVTTASFKAYWERTNKVVFPPNFQIDLASNCQNERLLFSIAQKWGQKAYLMPVTVSTADYLPALFF
jgi:methylenetetrahydrofolate reductase (NADPH)